MQSASFLVGSGCKKQKEKGDKITRLQVRGSNDPNTQAREIDNLRAAASAAEADGMGLYTTNEQIRSASVFSFDTQTASTGAEAIAAFGKGMHT
jgi:hypothetical protein